MPWYHQITCKVCGFKGKSLGRIYCSRQCMSKDKELSARIGTTVKRVVRDMREERHPRWKKTGLSRPGLHWWLNKKYGRADRCEGLDCRGISKHFEYALIKGKQYERKRENFIRLCRSCHSRYDGKRPKRRFNAH